MKLNHRAITLGALVLTGAQNILAADLHVPAGYATIQAAVDAAVSGDTVHIAPGIYVEQTWINGKNLTLIGRPGTILRAFPGMAPGIPGVVHERVIVFIGDFSVVTIKDLSFEGDQLGGQNSYALLGVVFDASGGSVENCRFTGFREKTPGAVGGAGILFWNGFDTSPLYPANVRGTTIVDSYSGIIIEGATDLISYEVSVIDNTITGVGLTTADDPLTGINIGDGTVGLVARNTVSGFAYYGDIGPGAHSIPFGILRLSWEFPDALPLPPMTFEDNVLLSNQVHLASFKADHSVVRNNTFDGYVAFSGIPPRLQTPAGLWFSGADVQVTGNQFRHLAQGIRLSGGDPFGIATNAALIDNRVCEVATNIVAEDGATYTETGTLTCPFPDPKLVILSWPGIEQGFSVQSAPAPSGPWTTSEAEVTRQDGQNQLVVPAASEQQFFRLAKP